MTTWICTRQDELCHHGIKGQKWGIRRFQNEDGSLTPAGEKRYNDQTPHSDKKEKQYKIPKNKSLHRLKLEDKYKQQGFSKEEAEQKAAKRIKAEIYVAAAAAVTVASCVAYAKYKGYTNDKTLKSNTEFQRIMKLAENAEIREGRQYLALNKMDKIKYKGLLGGELNKQVDRGLKERIYDITVKNKGDINIASRKRAEDAFIKLYKEDGEFKNNLLQRVSDIRLQSDSYYMINEKLNRSGAVNDRVLRKYGYDAFNILLVDSDKRSTSNASKFYDSLRKQGMNAIVDVNDKKYSGYKAKMPIITFDGEFEYTKRALGRAEIEKNSNKAYAMILGPEIMKAGATYAGVLGASSVISKRSIRKQVLLYKEKHPNTKMSDSEIANMIKQDLADQTNKR